MVEVVRLRQVLISHNYRCARLLLVCLLPLFGDLCLELVIVLHLQLGFHLFEGCQVHEEARFAHQLLQILELFVNEWLFQAFVKLRTVEVISRLDEVRVQETVVVYVLIDVSGEARDILVKHSVHITKALAQDKQVPLQEFWLLVESPLLHDTLESVLQDSPELLVSHRR